MAAFSLTTASNLFKTKYGKLSENVYNSANVLLGRVKKSYEFVGDSVFIPVPTAFQGGVGSGSLPTANVATYGKALITSKKMYSVVQIDREAIKASMNDEGAFVRATKHVVEKGVESWMRNMSRALFNDGTGALGTTTAANATGTQSAPVVIISTATWKEANFEENDYINVDAYADVFAITAVNPSTRAVTLAQISGSTDLTGVATAKILYMQNSKNNDPEGLKGVCDATTGSKYNIAIARRWQSTQIDAASAGISTDLMNQLMLEVQRKSGKVPNLLITSFKQYRKILNFLEDQKQYIVEPRSPELQGKISFKGLEFMSAAGAVGIFPERFCDDDRLYALNDNFIEIMHRPDFGWFDDDGTVFLRDASSDSYSARYGGYLQAYIVPSFQGVITNLA